MTVRVTGLAILSALASTAARGGNPAGENPDLERGGAHWNVCAPNFSVRDGAGRNGSRGLVWEGVDTNRYCISSYAVPFRPGQNLRISIWKRNESLSKGEPGFCVEFFDAKGNYMSGVGSKPAPNQPPAAKGAWRRYVAETGPIPQGTHRCSIDLSVSKDVTGRCAWDDVEVEAIGESHDALFYSSAPDDKAFEGTVRLFATTYADLRGIAPSNLVAAFILDTVDGRRRIAPDSFVAGRAELAIDVARLKVGPQRMQFTLGVKNGPQLDERRLPFERLAAPAPAKVCFDAHRRLIVDGRPRYPLLVYVTDSARTDPRILSMIRESPFRMVMSYALHMSPEELDLYHAEGVRVFASFCSAFRDAWNVPIEIGEGWDEMAFVARGMLRVKDHPALLGWYLSDEPTEADMPRCRTRYKLARAIDPLHPVLNVLCHARQARSTMATCDVVGLDCYPVPGAGTERSRPANLMAAAAVTCEALALMRGDKPFWFVPQAYPHEPERARFPTVHELRAMVWQSIACGADGVLFYSLGEILGNREKPGYSRAEAWRVTCAVACEIAAHEEMLLSTEPAPAVRDVPKEVVARAWRLNGRTFVVAVNLTHRPVTCTVMVEGRPLALAFGPDDVLMVDARADRGVGAKRSCAEL